MISRESQSNAQEYLCSSKARIPATELPSSSVPAEAGLYAWWGGNEATTDLSSGLGIEIRPGLIYAGQAV